MSEMADRRDHACYPIEPSASSASKVLDVTSLPFFVPEPESELFGRDICEYDLQHLARVFNVSSSEVESEVLAERCIKAIADQCGVRVTTRRNKEVKLTSELPPLYNSTHERPDILVYNKDSNRILLLIEVHSSPIIYTERKAVLGAADMIRFLRNSDKSFSEFTSFVFPKIGEKQCIIKITVKWQEFKFMYSLQRLQDLQEALKGVQDLLKSAMTCFPPLPKRIEPQLMLLSQDDLNFLSSDDPYQLQSSRSIVFADAKYVYKVIKDYISHSKLLRVYIGVQDLVQHGNLENPKHFVIARQLPNNILIFKYPKVRYNPLKVKDAYRVLRTLSEKIKDALCELHEFGIIHNDVRLPNICFDDDFNAVLVDLDRASANGSSDLVGTMDSCMYIVPHNKRDFSLDFIQLGWLLAWVLHSEGDYHQRKWEDLPQSIRNDQFISDLINCGQYSQTKLLKSTEIRNTERFESVFEQ